MCEGSFEYREWLRSSYFDCQGMSTRWESVASYPQMRG
jgi:hypothetical protein